MPTCDVLIVGGGPAGSSCAWSLRRKGLNVIILDKKAFPRDKICAGWITPPIIEELQIDADDYRAGRVLQPIRGFRVSMIGGEEVETHYDQPVSFGIRRCEFDNYLLNRCGATLRVGESFATMERRGGNWLVNGDIETPLVIGAGGHFCPVARRLGASPSGRGQLVVAAQEIEFEMSPQQMRECGVRGEVPELFFCKDLTGYAWCFRKGNHLNIGLGREDTEQISDHVAAFCDYLEKLGRTPKGIAKKFNGHAYILYGHTRRKLIDDGVLLIGDAAGLAYPQSGEGIRPAIESGLMAAELIARLGGAYTADRLATYPQRLVDRFGDPAPSQGLAAFIPAAVKQHVAATLMGMDWFVRSVVVERWFLHRQQPALTAGTV